jgi:hypothetical protein
MTVQVGSFLRLEVLVGSSSKPSVWIVNEWTSKRICEYIPLAGHLSPRVTLGAAHGELQSRNPRRVSN